MIFKHNPKTPEYAMIANATLCDKRLSFKARGILGYLISKPPDWVVQFQDLVNNSTKDGEYSIRSGIKELRQYGYAKLKRVYVDGRIFKWEMDIFDTPEEVDENPDVFPEEDFSEENHAVDEKLDRDNLHLENLEVENRGVNKKQLTKKELTKKYLIPETEHSGTVENSSPTSPKPKREPTPEEKAYKELEEYFIELTGLPVQAPTNEAGYKAYQKLWKSPGKEILGWVSYDLNKAKILVKESVDKMRKDNLTIASFNSISKVAVNQFSQRNVVNNGHHQPVTV